MIRVTCPTVTSEIERQNTPLPLHSALTPFANAQAGDVVAFLMMVPINDISARPGRIQYLCCGAGGACDDLRDLAELSADQMAKVAPAVLHTMTDDTLRQAVQDGIKAMADYQSQGSIYALVTSEAILISPVNDEYFEDWTMFNEVEPDADVSQLVTLVAAKGLSNHQILSAGTQIDGLLSWYNARIQRALGEDYWFSLANTEALNLMRRQA